MRRTTRLVCALATSGALALTAACGGTREAQADGVIDYWLWDSAQQPGYQRCADAFEAQNPDLSIRITQYGWDDYWTMLTSGFIAGTGPDVFIDHLARFAQFADLGVLASLDELEATRGIEDADYQEGLAELWKGEQGQRYGAPKDWDTVAIFYNRALTQEAGISDEQMANLDWNPEDGGSFEQVMARLTVDVNGVRGDEPGFDRTRIRQYGMNLDDAGGGQYGQTQWSPFTGSTGWSAVDQNPWPHHFNLDDPTFQNTLQWYFGLAEKGYMPPFAAATDHDRALGAGNAATAFHGSWMISTLTALQDRQGQPLDMRIAPTPVGPSGQRASMFNGVADSVSAQSPDPENAARWVAFLSGEECQNIIGESGVVFPARPSGTERAMAFNENERGLDVSAFTVHLEDDTTFPPPVAYHAQDIQAVMQPTLDSIYMGSEPVSEMSSVNDLANDLIARDPE